MLELDQIIVDDAIQVRQNGLDADRVEQYALAMVEYGGWGEFPPLVVFRDPENDAVYLAGGFHRRAAIDAARQRLVEGGKEPIEIVPCDMRTGDRAAAVEFAEDDNLQHGLNLSSKDKRHIYWRRLTEGHIWLEYSNRRIAAELGVTEGTVRNWASKIPGAQNYAPDRKVGKDGKSYPAQSGAADEDQADDPSQSDRELQAQSALADELSTQQSDDPDLALSDNDYQIGEPDRGDQPVDEPEFDDAHDDLDDNAIATPPRQPLREYQVLIEQLEIVAEATSEIRRIQPSMLAGHLFEDERHVLLDLLADVFNWIEGRETEAGISLLDHIVNLSQVLKDEDR